jgi:GDP-L-fucose synthase
VNGLDIDQNIIYPINIGQNKGYSIKESAQLIAEVLNFKGKLFFNEEYSDGSPIKILDDKKFRDIFPDYKFYDHKKGIEETINYYKKIL